MNKKDLIMIARALYLQQSISRQLFAKFDFTEEISQLSGSFRRSKENLFGLFAPFIGFSSNKIQFIQKNGTDFTVYSVNSEGQVDKNYKHEVKGFANLANYLSNISSQISAPGKSLHSILKRISQVLSNDNIWEVYSPSKSKRQQKYNMFFQKTQNSEQAEKRVTTWMVKQTLQNWENSIISKLDEAITLAKNIHNLTITQKSDSIVSFIIGLRQTIISRMDGYIRDNANKLLDKNTAKQKVIDVVAKYLKDNNDVLTMLQKNNQSADVKSALKTQFSNSWQDVNDLQQIVGYLQQNKDNEFAQKLLQIIETANTPVDLIAACQQIGFDCQKSFNDQFNDNKLEQYKHNEQMNNMDASEWKTFVLTVVNYLNKNGRPFLNFTTWEKYYQLIKNRFAEQQDQMGIVQEFNKLIDVCKTNAIQIEDLIKRYCASCNVIEKAEDKKNSGKKLTPKQQEKYQQSFGYKSDAFNAISNLFNGLTQKNQIVENIIASIESRLGTATPQVIAKIALSSLPYVWIENTELLTEMKKMLNAQL